MNRSGLVCVLFLSFICSWAFGATGRTHGTFAVTSTGAATYSIPIWAPPGPHGMQPHISLTYNSQSGNGYLGVGWSLSGLSSISRCNLTYAQDVFPAAISLSTTDGYCLDGQRLRLTGGTYGTASSTYQTEIADFKNVTATGTAGSGPAYFVVKGPTGLQYEYGNPANGSNAQVLLGSTATSWMLDKVTDTAGNTMTIAYEPPSSNLQGMTVPATISWTPSSHGVSTYNYTMNFDYSTVSVPVTAGYIAGQSVVQYYLLKHIAIEFQSTVVKDYFLTYTASATTSRETLTSIQDCADSAGSNCLAPTSVSYQAGSQGVTGPTTLTSSQTALTLVSTVYDFNGDGINDLLYTYSNTLYVAFGGASGYSTPISTGITSTSATVARIDGSGSDSILVPVSGTWYYYKWNGSSFSGTSIGVSATALPPLATFVDVNADGLADLTQLEPDGYYHVRLNTTGSGAVGFSSTDQTTQPALISTLSFVGVIGSHRLDLTGDGQNDLIVATQGGCERYLKQGSTICVQYYPNNYSSIHYTGTTFTDTGLAANSTDPLVDLADFNGDGCIDTLTTISLYLSPCGGPGFGTTINITAGTAVGALDWNGDGRADVLIAQSNGYLGVILSTGTGLSTTVIGTSIPSNAFVAHNITGDGQDGLITVSTTSPYAIQYYLPAGNRSPPDLATTITDGYGNFVKPTYVSLAQDSAYSAYWNTATYPYVNYLGPTYVVNNVIFSDPSSPPSGTYNIAYTYYGGWANLQGRGFADFGAVSTADSRYSPQLGDVKYYQQVFPYIGRFYRDRPWVIGSSFPLADESGTPAYLQLSSTAYQQRYFVYFSNWTNSQYEYGGTESGDLITTSSTIYGTPDNYGNFPSITSSVTDNDPTSPYLNDTWTTTTTNTPNVDTTHWCLNLLTETQIEYTASVNSGNITRTKTYIPDTTTCRYTQVVTEPSNPTYEVTEAFGYDNFGNVDSDAVTGVNMAARTITTTWSNGTNTTGQLPLTVTDPSGAQTQYSYNYTYGLPASTTDPNNETTSWQYGDGFGRLTQETRPDGTYTTYTYGDCSAGGCPLAGQTQGLYIQKQTYATGGALQYGSTDWRDSAGRPLMQTTNMLANSTYARNEVRYDSLGHMVQHAAPCTYSTPATACIYWTTTTYDVRNRPVEVQRPINQNNSTPQSTAYSYAGRTTVITDPYSQTRTLITDVNGWLRKTTDTYGYSVTLGYDQAGSNTSRTDSDGNTLLSATYAYGVGAFKVIAHDADLGNWSYDYDALGEVTGWWDANNQGAPTAPFTMVYDALGRPQSRSEPDYYTYWTYGSSATGHNIGKLQSVCTGLGIKPSSCTGTGYSESEAYDSIGRLYQKAINIPGVATYTYTWGYSATTGLLNTLTYPTSISGYAFKLQYGYQNGILDAVTDTSDTPNVTLWTGNTVNADQQVTEETLGNGIVTNRSYDDVTHWLNSIQSGVGGGAGVQNQAFLFDEVGDVTERQDNNRGLTEDIYYDNDYRLSYTKLNGTQNLSISYADNGNITSRSDVNGGKTWVYEYNGKIHAVALDGSALDLFGYDANGNTTLRYRNTITWSSYNYPTAISAGFGSTAESVSLAYGPDRQRWSQYYTGNGDAEQTYYVGGLMDVVTAGSITTYRHYIQVGNEQVAIYSRTNTGTNAFDYVLSDHQGSVASITNASGAVVTSESYTPFGSRRNPSTWSGAASNSDLTASAAITRQGYTFQTQLGLWMGLNHMNGRVQDAITGRFLSPDPVVQAPDVTDSYNRYSYTSNNPLSYTDPSGFEINLLCQICAYGGDVDGAGIDSGEWDCYGNCGQGFANSLPNSIGSSSYNSSVASDFLAEQGNSSAANAIGLNQSFDSSLGSGPVDQFNQYGMDAGLIDPTDLMSPLQLTEWAFKTVGESVANNADTLALGLWNRISNLDSPLAGAGPLALGETLAEAAEGAATATEGAEAAGEFSLYDSTGGLKGLNTNVTADEFSANLQANGYTAAETTGKNGSVTVLQNGQGSTWTIYTRSSTGDMGAQFIGPNGQFLKYNLGVQGLPLPGP